MGKEEIINNQIEKFEDEIFTLQGCIMTLKGQLLIDEIKKIKKDKS